MERYLLDVVSEIFLGESADTLSTESQAFRDAVEEMHVWNTTRSFIGYLSRVPFAIELKECSEMIACYLRKLGALLPGNSNASAVVDEYLDRVIEHAISLFEISNPKEMHRKEQTLLCSLFSQDLSSKVGVL